MITYDKDLLKIYADSFRDNWELPALTDYTSGETLTYGDLARRIARTHIFFRECGLQKGDTVALLGKNTISWVVCYMATITYGAAIVPILQEFNVQDAMHIINHSDSELLFVADSIWENIEFEKLHKVKVAMSLDTADVLAEHPDNSGRARRAIINVPRLFKKEYPAGFDAVHVKYPAMPHTALAEINYTSGTTGFSKGVMLTHGNLVGNVEFGALSRLHYRGSRCLSFLPLAHAYGCAFDMLVPLAVGTHVTLFGKLPSPKALLKGLAEVRPNLILCVPLILEKIYRNRILPEIQKPAVKRMMAIPGLRSVIGTKIKNSLVKAFGGDFEEIITGGAPLNREVEEFFRRIRFPYTVGYGMTECGPLISYSPWRRFTPGSAGRTLRGLMTAKILKEPGADLGEIVVKGTNVMKGYYKNPDATLAVLEADGWLHTGDMGTLGDPDDRTIMIKGRYKTMILSATGQNIYPEEIEAKFNNMPYVNETIIVERGGGLTGLIYPDIEAAGNDGLSWEDITALMDDNRKEVNKLVAPYERIDSVEIVDHPFEKTPKQSIKRFLYK